VAGGAVSFLISELRCSIGGIVVILGWLICYVGDKFTTLGCAIAGIERTEDLIPDEDDL
jgi:hypothetical protein